MQQLALDQFIFVRLRDGIFLLLTVEMIDGEIVSAEEEACVSTPCLHGHGMFVTRADEISAWLRPRVTQIRCNRPDCHLTYIGMMTIAHCLNILPGDHCCDHVSWWGIIMETEKACLLTATVLSPRQ